jgi:secreted trypsin-like serine protease
VRNNWVVTAAHCVYDAQYGEVHAPGKQDVLTGTDDLSSSSGKRLGVEAIYVHEKFKHKTYNNRGIPVNDIALLKLKGDGIGAPIKPLTEKEEPRIVVSNQKAMIAGWGKTTEKGSPSLQLMQADIPLVDRGKCNGQGAYEGTVEDNMLCAGTDDGSQDSCTGDSGGPMTKGGFLIGLVSWPGDACGQAFQYGVYTRVSQFADWIEACINDPGACKSMKKLSNGNTSQ